MGGSRLEETRDPWLLCNVLDTDVHGSGLFSAVVLLTIRTLLASASVIWGCSQSCETLEHLLDGVSVLASMARVHPGLI